MSDASGSSQLSVQQINGPLAAADAPVSQVTPQTNGTAPADSSSSPTDQPMAVVGAAMKDSPR